MHLNTYGLEKKARKALPRYACDFCYQNTLDASRLHMDMRPHHEWFIVRFSAPCSACGEWCEILEAAGKDGDETWEVEIWA